MSYLKSSILSKWVMAISGVFLVLFIIVHALGNMQIFLGRDTFNTYAHFLQSLGELLWVIRGFLILMLVLHIITSIRLKFLNLSAKPVKYQVKKYLKAKLTSRTMIWTGILIFAFLVYHLMHFTMGQIYNQYYGFEDKFYKSFYPRHDAWYMVTASFHELVIVIPYVVGVILLGFHLNHATQSMFQTAGMNHPKYFGFVQGFSVTLAWIVTLLYLSIPIGIWLFNYGGGQP